MQSNSIIVVVGALTRTLFHSVYDLEAAQMNMQRSLIRELTNSNILNITEAAKNISWRKGEGLGLRNIYYQALSYD